jgi:hypothetical protein
VLNGFGSGCKKHSTSATELKRKQRGKTQTSIVGTEKNGEQGRVAKIVHGNHLSYGTNSRLGVVTRETSLDDICVSVKGKDSLKRGKKQNPEERQG